MDRTRHALRCVVYLFLAGASVLAAPAARSSSHPCAPALRAPYADWAFLGYACTDACRAQKTGFAWAERNGVAEGTACAAQVGEQAQGCRAYAEAAVTAEQAGFEWARENELTDPCACTGAGRAFQAGCEAYLESVRD